jgi:hypothetical protein
MFRQDRDVQGGSEHGAFLADLVTPQAVGGGGAFNSLPV